MGGESGGSSAPALATATHDLDTDDPQNDQAHVPYTSFCRLRRVVNKDLDDVLRGPTFHRFRNLPLELRQEIYAQYFLGQEDCKFRHWPEVQLRNNRNSHFRRMRDWSKRHEPFFPNICLIDRNIGLEAAAYLMQATTFEFAEKGHHSYGFAPANSTVEPFIIIVKRLGGVSLLQEVRRAIFPQTGIFMTVFRPKHERPAFQIDNTFALLRACSQLREITISVVFREVSLFERDGHHDLVDSPWEHRSTLRDHVPRIPLHAFHKCEQLQKVTLRGQWDRFEGKPKSRSPEAQRVRRESLIDLGLRLKRIFEIRKQDVKQLILQDTPGFFDYTMDETVWEDK